MAQRKQELVCEMVGGEPYEYYPLGEYVVIAPGVCGSEPTFKYTRINVEHALGRLAMGWTVEQVAPTDTDMKKRDFERGRKLFGAVGCYACHRFGNEGQRGPRGRSGPAGAARRSCRCRAHP